MVSLQKIYFTGEDLEIKKKQRLVAIVSEMIHTASLVHDDILGRHMYNVQCTRVCIVRVLSSRYIINGNKINKKKKKFKLNY